jgi:hypothetical protein
MKKHPPSIGQIFQQGTLVGVVSLWPSFSSFGWCFPRVRRGSTQNELCSTIRFPSSIINTLCVCVFLTHLCKAWTSLWYHNQCGCELWLFSNRQRCGRFDENGDESCDQPTASEPGLGRSRSTIWHSERIQRQSSWRGGESSWEHLH